MKRPTLSGCNLEIEAKFINIKMYQNGAKRVMILCCDAKVLTLFLIRSKFDLTVLKRCSSNASKNELKLR